MRYSSIPSAQTVVQHCEARGIKNIVVSPGSRNAPLTIGFSENSFFKCFSIVDERSAGFFALGLSQQTGQPVVLVCTSGSALLNYYPAVAEAFYSDIPLVIISADRPPYKIDVGDGQTIRQDHVFERHIGYSANLKQDIVHSKKRVERYMPKWLKGNSIEYLQQKVQAFNETELNTALNMVKKCSAPVHINVPFEEPLYDFLNEPSIHTAVVCDEEDRVKIPDLDDFIATWNASERKMVLVGVNRPNTVKQTFLDQLANDPSVVVLTETTSNLHHPHFFTSIDSIIAPIEKKTNQNELFEKLQPEVLLTFGGLIVSKKVKAFLRNKRPKVHWHIDSNKAFDTFFCLDHHFKMDINSFFKEFMKGVKLMESSYFSLWKSFREIYEMKRKEYLEKIDFSDMLAFHHVARTIPKNYQLQLANSSTVRYAQLFDMDPSIEIFCNRGTSGIDGSTSTAVGASVYSQKATLLITGDLSFLYDSNGLWNNYIRADFRIILVNNGGGGIFRILPGNEETDNFETYFETVQHLDVSHLCQMYGIEYFHSANTSELEMVVAGFYKKSKAPRLLEIRTPRLMNDKILLAYFDFISSGIINH